MPEDLLQPRQPAAGDEPDWEPLFRVLELAQALAAGKSDTES